MQLTGNYLFFALKVRFFKYRDPFLGAFFAQRYNHNFEIYEKLQIF